MTVLDTEVEDRMAPELGEPVGCVDMVVAGIYGVI